MAEPAYQGMAAPNKRLLLSFAGILLLFTVADIFRGKTTEVAAQKEVPAPPKFASKFMGPSIKFLYCYSWGYRRVFEQYAGLLQQKYPNLAIEGDNYPPIPWKSILAQVLSYAKLALIVSILASFNPFVYFGETPGVFAWALQNKLYACMMIFFVSNAIETNLISTGAFEVSVDNMPVWSKLEAGRIPQPPELFQIIDNHFKMNSGASSLTGGGGGGRGDSYKDEL